MATTKIITARPQVSVIIPARNEEVSLSDCLQSLVTQSGIAFEIIVVDDHSSDRTREIAESFPGVRVIPAGPLPAGWTGKNNAVTTGAKAARGEWLLFTDADTVHLPGSLARALKEAKDNGAELLSYSPEQIAVTFWEMATLPVVFAELAWQYSPSRVSDPASPIAAANGQYILIRRETYDAVGAHAAVATDILEDVALARAVKASGRKIRFRYAADAVRTRMYRSYRQLRDGWTKNLALLFPNPGWLAVKTLALWGLGWGLMLWPFFMLIGAVLSDRAASLTRLHDIFLTNARVVDHWWWITIVVVVFGRNFSRLRRANFDVAMEFLGALFGMPMFAYLLLRSKRAHANGSVAWKGRTYGAKESPVNELDHAPTPAGRLS
jgi:glycosyltransferase involved in cell wall biosynthesis